MTWARVAVALVGLVVVLAIVGLYRCGALACDGLAALASRPAPADPDRDPTED